MSSNIIYEKFALLYCNYFGQKRITNKKSFFFKQETSDLMLVPKMTFEVNFHKMKNLPQINVSILRKSFIKIGS